jgi:cytochrome d ubiquinol oxidase subunit I
MDVVLLARLQFAFTVFFHFIFVPLTLGLSLLIAVMQTLYVRSGDETYKRMVKFWGKLFLINFTLGVVSGITLEFQFGTNWSRYSAFAGDIFGPLLAIETSAFFLESTFIAVWAFGWERVSKRIHLASIWAVVFGGNLSALWIILANGWMQHPVGYTIVDGRARLESFTAVLANPYAWGQYLHTIAAAWVLSGFFVIGVSAWHLARKHETAFFTRSVRLAAPFTLVMALAVPLLGHVQGQIMASFQPAKLAAMESHWQTEQGAPVYLLVWPNAAGTGNAVQALPVPGALSFMAYNNFSAEVKGLNDFAREDRPPVLLTFLSFRFMAGLGALFILLAFAAWRYREKLGDMPLLAKILTCSIPLPYLAIMAGWTLAEVGRQPWIVYGLMRTGDAASPVPGSSVALSLLAFLLVYGCLGLAAVWLLGKNACAGPAAQK